ncbi:PilZ domain-containing protein [Proteiniborus sp. MB09-C3]|uniref:flagellar brake protein n=1 Tax=Proteiniborus sp. MB09-C3 TaxID=3050072 RepID=UPI002557542C|nr:PilZ domain-containing protein [Proteiniborus sp. MB09-C3]WIV10877.1 PilZ domain-containing protein [Proteiniborus sp. MB09-C3]
MSIGSFALKVGDKIEISKLEYPVNKYSSQILDILNDKEYIIGGPIRRSTIIHIRPNTIIEVSYYKEKIGKFIFKALVRDIWEKGIYKLRIERLNDIIKIQERNFFRLPISIKVQKKYEVKNEGEDKAIEEICRTGDISGGGLRLFSNFKHKKNDQLSLTLFIEDMEFNMQGEVVRVFESRSDDYKYEIGVKFKDIDSIQRDTIVKFIFEQQRELRKKGLI